MSHLVTQEGLADAIQIDSAGTIGYHSGEPADPRMRQAASRRGITLTSTARQVKPDDLAHFDYIIAMDEENLAYLKQLDANGQYADRIHSFVSFCEKHSDPNVPDPYYGGAGGFEHVLNLLEDGCQQLLAQAKDKLA